MSSGDGVIGIGTGVIEMRTGRNGMGMRVIVMMARGGRVEEGGGA